MFEPHSRERFAAIAFWCVPGVSRTHLEKLVAQFGKLADALGASTADLVHAGLPPETAARVAEGASERAGEAAIRASDAMGARILLPGDEAWPAAFERVRPRPGALFVLGQLPRHPAAAIVGSREADAYGMDMARALGVELATAGCCVISGGALGVDGAAHAGALATGGLGATVAVLGCGLDLRYPPRHADLLDQIAARGGLLGELPPGTPPRSEHFPRRNRLIAALADALVVVRAAERSGSLVTAREAGKLGCPLLAVPGPAGDPLARGTNLLLRHGARMCEGTADVLAAMREGPAPSPLPFREPAHPAGTWTSGGSELPAPDAHAGATRVRAGLVTGAPLHRPAPRHSDGPEAARFAGRGAAPKAEGRGTGDDERVLSVLGAVPASADAVSRAAALSAAQASAALTRLELLGLAVRMPGNLYQRHGGQ